MIQSRAVIAGLASVCLVLIAMVWTSLASVIFLAGSGLWRQQPAAFPLPRALWQFWVYRPYATINPQVALWIDRSEMIASLGLLLAVGGIINHTTSRKLKANPLGWTRRFLRGATDNHGRADWMSMREAEALFRGPHSTYGGVVVGEAYRVNAQGPFDPDRPRTWGQGGRARLLIDPCTTGPTHSLIFAGSGGFKTTSAVSTILTWHGSSVILDPSCELGPMLTEALQKQGKRVFTLSPNRPEDAERWGLNALDWIDVKDPMVGMHIGTVVQWLWHESGGSRTSSDRFFEPKAKDLVRCLLAHILFETGEPMPPEKTLKVLRGAIAVPEKQLRAILETIHTSSASHMARQLAAELKDAVEETFSGIHQSAALGTSWLSNTAYADLVSGDAMTTADIRHGDATVFVQIPIHTLIDNPAPARVIIGALMNSVYQADGEIRGRVLFLLDEAARLGRMNLLEVARDAGRKYGITLQLLFQSVGQLEGQWGRDGKRAWYEGTSWRGYAAVQDDVTAEEISKACGTMGVIAYSESDNTGRQKNQNTCLSSSRSSGTTQSIQEISRRLILPAEVTEMRSDDMIVFIPGRKPLRCGRPIYFRRKDMRAQVNDSRFRREQ